jgi:dihydrolipoamide dehydrogenase
MRTLTTEVAVIGRRANVDDIGPEHSGLGLDAAGVPAHDRRTGRAGGSAVFIAGDASEDRPLLREAAEEGRIASDNAGRWPDVRVRASRAALRLLQRALRTGLPPVERCRDCGPGA